MKSFGISSLLLASVLVLSCSKERESYTVKEQKIVESVYSSVTVTPSNLYKVYAQVPGQIIKFSKEVGDSIAFGESICFVDALGAKTTTKNAALNLQLIQSQLNGDANAIEDAELEITAQKEQLDLDKKNYNRLKELFAKGIIAESELEQAKLKMDATSTRLATLENRKQRLKRELSIQRDQAQNNYVNSLASSDDSKVSSVLSGIVYAIYKEAGEMVIPQEPIALVGDADAFEIQLLIDEIDISQVHIGQEVAIELEAYPNEVYTAEITRIYPSIDHQTQSFEVIAKFTKEPKRLYLGLTGEANIVVREVEKTMVIPREYLIDGKYVETETGKVEVKTGLMSLGEVEIKSGLKSGDIIFLPEE